MKKNIFKLLALATVFTISMQSCTVEIREDADKPTTDGSGTTTGSVMSGSGTLSGTITKDLTIKKGTYYIDGLVRIIDGVKLTIEPGATFYAKTTTTSGLIILKGAKAYIEGTANEPIVFTTESKKPGDWCGITIYGDAPIKANGGGSTATSEDGLNQIYGGTDVGSNSGVYRYIRVEYGGRKIGDGHSEFNNITFYAVGSGTIVENIVSYKGTDDGVEFFGGTVSAKNFISYGNHDDSFDWQDGWYGQDNSNWFAYQTGTGNFGMEIESSSNADNTAPKISGITLIREAGTNPEVAGSAEISAIQFKKQGSGIFTNVFIDGYKNLGGKNAFAVLIQDAGTETAQVLTNKVKVSPIFVQNSDNFGNWGYAFTSTQPKTYTNDNTVKKISLTSGAWATVNGVDLTTLLK